MTRHVLCSLALFIPLTASAQSVDILDATLERVRSFNAGGPEGQGITDMEFDSAGDLWMAINRSGFYGSQKCDPDDVVRQVDGTGAFIADWGAGISDPYALALDPAGGFWVTGSRICDSTSQNATVHRVSAEGAVTTGNWSIFGAIYALDRMPNGSLVGASHDNQYQFNPDTLVRQDTTTTSRVTWMEHNPVTGQLVTLTRHTGILSLYTPNPLNPNYGYNQGATLDATIDLNDLGVGHLKQMTVLDSGEILLVGHSTSGEQALGRYSAAYAILDSAGSTVVETGAFPISRRLVSAVTVSPTGEIAVASKQAALIADPDVVVIPGDGPLASIEVSFTLPIDLSPTDAVGVRLMDAVSTSPSDMVSPPAGWTGTSVSVVAGLDGSGSLSLYPFRQSAPYRDRQFYVKRDGSGSTALAGTPITVRFSDVVLPATPEDVVVDYVEIHPNPPSYATSSYAASLAGEDVVSVHTPVTCVAGLDAVDLDDDGEDDVCVAPSATVEASATLGRGVFVYANAYIGAHAYVGAGSEVGANSVVADRATVGDNTVLGDGVVLGRRAVVGDDTDIGADAQIGRSASIGSNVELAPSSSVGYAATVGDNVSLSANLTLGALATLGGDSGGAVSCAGSLVIARGSSVAADAPNTLTCLGSAVIGPDVVIGSGATLGSGLRVRKGVQIGSGFTSGESVRIGRDVSIGDDVSVEASVALSALVSVCDDATVSNDLARATQHSSCQ